MQVSESKVLLLLLLLLLYVSPFTEVCENLQIKLLESNGNSYCYCCCAVKRELCVSSRRTALS
jgi:hypothetical protein